MSRSRRQNSAGEDESESFAAILARSMNELQTDIRRMNTEHRDEVRSAIESLAETLRRENVTRIEESLEKFRIEQRSMIEELRKEIHANSSANHANQPVQTQRTASNETAVQNGTVGEFESVANIQTTTSNTPQVAITNIDAGRLQTH